ncbi:uncharacterized protein LY89DRAFT_669770 [Mollisia scopiformis]|uniref:Uncharacterized protein n=1 Tax=Mollisia scopiformis TaxID=149040 RepID=A0A194X7Z4_MOLSC|nr:uncharacterized protein LY89DRAFT_669770 [Mollisia scopiformis]KUJ16234.1 hypothetical protein LY89DRAFT_669770 [Mollisia scopiformis]
MRSKSKSSEELKEWDIVHNVETQEVQVQPNIQVVICSCSAHISTKDVRILHGSLPHNIIAVPSLPQLRSLVTNYLPIPSAFLSPRSKNALRNINSLHSRFQRSNLPSRALKYIRNPLKLFELADRNRVHAQKILSVRFVFNLTCVILWVLIRKFLELFGIRLSAFALVGDYQNPGRGLWT